MDKPRFKTTWGLGFVVYKGADGNTWVGHVGSCPGYETTLQINLKNKRAYSVMINANGTSPKKYLNGIKAIINKAKTPKKEESTDDNIKKINLQEFVGYYSLMPWLSEAYISTWNEKLVLLGLPSENPGNSMTFYKHIEGDTFRRIRDGKVLGETLIFERDKTGKIIRCKKNENYAMKIDR